MDFTETEELKSKDLAELVLVYSPEGSLKSSAAYMFQAWNQSKKHTILIGRSSCLEHLFLHSKAYLYNEIYRDSSLVFTNRAANPPTDQPTTLPQAFTHHGPCEVATLPQTSIPDLKLVLSHVQSFSMTGGTSDEWMRKLGHHAQLKTEMVYQFWVGI